MGSGKAIELVLEGTALSPAQALEIGLIHRACRADQLLGRGDRDRRSRLARRSRVAVAAAKRAVYEGGSMELAQGLHVERAAFMRTLTQPSSRTRDAGVRRRPCRARASCPPMTRAAREALLDGSYVDLAEPGNI